MKPVRLLSLFSRIGAFERALQEAHIPYELLAYCEVDRYASKAYSLLHHVSEDMNLGDITKVDVSKLPKNRVDMIVHGSPCQSFSLIGKQEGGEKGSNTKSSLLWNSVEIIRATLPKFVLWENVPNVLSAKHKPVFDEYINELNSMGYESTYKILNAKDYGVAQSRKRVFVLSVLAPSNLKDFSFPEEQELKVLLKDLIDDEVAEKYFLSENMKNYWKEYNKIMEKRGNGFRFAPKPKTSADIAFAITTKEGCRCHSTYINYEE